MAPNATPASVYRRGLRLLLDKDIAAWIDLWDDEGVFEFPFAPEGWPARLDGKAAVAAYMRGYPDHIDLHAFSSVRIHHTARPETIVVEMHGTGRLVRTGDPFAMTYIAVVTVRNGLILHYRDYWNPLALPAGGAADFAGTGAATRAAAPGRTGATTVTPG
ncbi:nuclear transport factor 2 family protein [Streptomyces subrutilus]|uniref:nuclear transport factor 2 family protein n=1 Tax=Streptomyces subrutilus TaxID=36818 RepID=UPI0033DB9284